ncbi:MAG: type II secretion system protein [Gammaproteobacteria bacterium PRO9]|nr:type II secretion system protein [Gammaproteobacteria bacterium PRO9]
MLRHRNMPAAQRGFNLLEMAIVLLIVGLLAGGLLMPLSARMDQQKVDATRQQLEQIRQALVGYALANDALPCPATPASNGLSSTTASGCTRQHGFIPAVTLGLTGNRNEDHLLLDAWGSPIRYSVTRSDSNGNGQWDFVRPGEMHSVTMANLAPALRVCTTAAGSTPTDCANSASTLAGNAPAAILSLGKDWATTASADERENAEATVGGGPSGRNYRVAGDDVFVSRSPSSASGDEFDDIVTWISPASFYGEMVRGGRLP